MCGGGFAKLPSGAFVEFRRKSRTCRPVVPGCACLESTQLPAVRGCRWKPTGVGRVSTKGKSQVCTGHVFFCKLSTNMFLRQIFQGRVSMGQVSTKHDFSTKSCGLTLWTFLEKRLQSDFIQ